MASPCVFLYVCLSLLVCLRVSESVCVPVNPSSTSPLLAVGVSLPVNLPEGGSVCLSLPLPVSCGLSLCLSHAPSVFHITWLFFCIFAISQGVSCYWPSLALPLLISLSMPICLPLFVSHSVQRSFYIAPQ